MSVNEILVIALGGSILQVKKESEGASYVEQMRVICKTSAQLSQLLVDGYSLAMLIGSGIVVGEEMAKQETFQGKEAGLPMDLCLAQSQGYLGYMWQQCLTSNMWDMGIRDRQAITLISQVEVDAHDIAFHEPTKPIGSTYSKSAAQVLMHDSGWCMSSDDTSRFRRLVASPVPQRVIELDAIRSLLSHGFPVILGGGIPVIWQDTHIRGVEAVVDKDYTSQLLATSLKAKQLLMVTDVPQVSLYFGSPNQKNLDRLTLRDAYQYMKGSHFATQSMRPKIAAAIRFLKAGGEEVIIAQPMDILDAIAHKAGTLIVQ